jgi:hypothetical protein
MINPGLSNERVEDEAFINYSIRRLLKNAHLLRFPCRQAGLLRCTTSSTRHLSVLGPQDLGSPRERDFAKLNLHLGIFEQPQKTFYHPVTGEAGRRER